MVLLTGDNVGERACEFLTMISTRFFRAVRCDNCGQQLSFHPSADNESMAMALAAEGWIPRYDLNAGSTILCPDCDGAA